MSVILSKEDIKRAGLIEDGEDNHYRDIGYDITVGDIYVPWNDDAPLREKVSQSSPTTPHKEWQIEPQGMVLIFAKEKVNIPDHICGFAMPKTSLCEDGILVLNTGIVDPGFRGRLSGTMLNFGKQPFHIKEGQVFLRLVFQQTTIPVVAPLPGKPGTPPATIADRPIRPDDVKIDKVRSYPYTFLNIAQTTKEVANRIVQKQTNAILFAAAVFGLGIALASFFITIWIAGWNKPTPPQDSPPAGKELTRDAESERAQDDRLKDLSERVKVLEGKKK